MTCETLHTKYEFVLTDLQNCCPANKNLNFVFGFRVLICFRLKKSKDNILLVFG